MARKKEPNLRPSENIECGPFIACIDRHPDTGTPLSIFFLYRGKSGTDLDQHLDKMGRELSRVLQKR
jgi:hypothetical protein